MFDIAIHCSTLQQIATDCNTLQHTATHCKTHTAGRAFQARGPLYPRSPFLTLKHTPKHCNTLQHTRKHSNTQQHTAKHCNILQHTATHCNTLQRTATHCNTHTAGRARQTGGLVNPRQWFLKRKHAATHCSKLQHTATYTPKVGLAELQGQFIIGHHFSH